jgi:drug/metabolite transporter (DMT)-like permease
MPALKGKALFAYLLVCIFWGSTYLAIRIGVGVLPPFLFGGVRFLIAGIILGGIALAAGQPIPRRPRDWATMVIVGILLLAGGNAFVVWAEQYTASGVASIFVVTVALWMGFFDSVIPGGPGALGWRVIIGLLTGFLGTALLIGASPAEILRADLRGPIALTFASASWSIGSVFAKRRPTETSPYMAAAIQMIAGGLVVSLVGTGLGEWKDFHLTTTGAAAMGYLVVFGSLIGYSAYVYALRHAPATIVGTYAYVNPVIAVLLGWWILDEVVTPRTFLAMGLILGAVVWIQLSHKLAAGKTTSPAPSTGPAVRETTA